MSAPTPMNPWRRGWQRYWAGLLLLACMASTWAQADEAVSLTPQQAHYVLGARLSYLEDKTGQLALADVQNPSLSAQFTPSTKETPNFGFTTSTYWMRVQLQNQDPAQDEWLLEEQYAPLQHLEAYVVGADGTVQRLSGGSVEPFALRAFKHRNVVFRLKLPTQQTTTVYLRAWCSVSR